MMVNFRGLWSQPNLGLNLISTLYSSHHFGKIISKIPGKNAAKDVVWSKYAINGSHYYCYWYWQS